MAMILSVAFLLAGCQPVPSEVVEEITKLEEAQQQTTQPVQELAKDSIANLFRNTPTQVDLDLGTIRLQSPVHPAASPASHPFGRSVPDPPAHRGITGWYPPFHNLLDLSLLRSIRQRGK